MVRRRQPEQEAAERSIRALLTSGPTQMSRRGTPAGEGCQAQLYCLCSQETMVMI